MPPATVRELAGKTEAVVLVDEAYVDFADADCLSLLADCPNLIVSPHAQQGLRAGGPALRLRAGGPRR